MSCVWNWWWDIFDHLTIRFRFWASCQVIVLSCSILLRSQVTLLTSSLETLRSTTQYVFWGVDDWTVLKMMIFEWRGFAIVARVASKIFWKASGIQNRMINAIVFYIDSWTWGTRGLGSLGRPHRRCFLEEKHLQGPQLQLPKFNWLLAGRSHIRFPVEKSSVRIPLGNRIPHGRTHVAEPIRPNRYGRTDTAKPTRLKRHGRTDTAEPTRPNRHGQTDTAEPTRPHRHGRTDTTAEPTRPNRHGRTDTAESTRPNRHGRTDTAESTRPNRHGRIDTAEPTRPNGHGRSDTTEPTRPRHVEPTNRHGRTDKAEPSEPSGLTLPGDRPAQPGVSGVEASQRWVPALG